MLHALHENNLPFINDGREAPVQEIPTTVSLLVIVCVPLLTVVASLLSPKGKALRALQNAERFAFRYTKLDQDATDAERRRAEELMDRWTQAAQTVSEKHREELLEHNDKYSRVIRTAHETRLADARHKGFRAPVSEAAVDGSGRAPDSA